MMSTITLSKETKSALDALGSKGSTYEQIVQNLIEKVGKDE